MFKKIQKPVPIALMAIIITIISVLIESQGFFGASFSYNFLTYAIYVVIMTHVTITAMSLSFHRQHTHKGVILSKFIDLPMQLWLWLITGMNKVDWVSIHMYHHAHSDQEKDPHSPIHKGFWHVFLLGAWDYAMAKGNPEIQKIADRIPQSKFERILSSNAMMGLILFSIFNVVLFGPFWGWVINLTNYTISPLFAVGGVNALAHWIGYKNHKSGDNSKNIGFLLPLNFMICGELDHNNHHGNQKSCSFRHKWYEFDIGYVYIRLFSALKLAEIKNVYNPVKMKEDLARRAHKIMEKNNEIIEQLEQLADELNMTTQEIKEQIKASFEGQKIRLEATLKEFRKDIYSLVKETYAYEFSIA